MATQAGQTALQQAQQAAQTREQLGQLALSEQQRQLKQQALNDRLQFTRTEAGRALFNQRQLADFAIRNAQSEQEFQQLAQQAEQNSRLRLLAMETAEKVLQNKLTQMQQRELNEYESARMTELTNYLGDLKEARLKAQAEAQKSGATWGAIGTVAGAVAGIPGGATGISAGAAVGGQLGQTGAQSGVLPRI
jgi:hypothetical protein